VVVPARKSSPNPHCTPQLATYQPNSNRPGVITAAHPTGSSLRASHRHAREARERLRRTTISAIRRPEFVSRAVLKWLNAEQIDTAIIDPGKPWQNGSNESFNGKFRDECLSMQWFTNRIDAKILIEDFRLEYNAIRPHSSLGQLTPAEFRQQLATTKPEKAIS
jgi:transposase InsO family protein